MKKIVLMMMLLMGKVMAQGVYDTSGLYDYHMGKPEAPIKMSIFFAFTCVHCKRWHDEVWPTFKKNYVDKGLVYVTLIDVPIDQTSYVTSLVAHCKKGIAFEGLKDTLFDNQEKYMGTGADDEDRAANALSYVKKQVVLAGLKNQDIEACLASEPLKSAVMNRLKEARDRYGFTSTPGFMINGKVFPKYLKYDDLAKEVNALLYPEEKTDFFTRIFSKIKGIL